jgi:hypothetical protein
MHRQGLRAYSASKDIVILFMTAAVLNQFKASKGCEVGLDGNVALTRATSSAAPSQGAVPGLELEFPGRPCALWAPGGSWARLTF